MKRTTIAAKCVRMAAIALLAAVSFPPTLRAQTPAKTAQEPSPAEKYFTNTELINQDGRAVRFYNDVLKGKVVVLDFFFSACQASCVPMNRNFAKVQELLGNRVGKEVFFVSVTVDPEMDTPAQLKKYAGSLHAGPGWLLLTGQKANVDFILNKLGQYVADKNDHTNIWIIGNESTGLWKKAFGLAKAEDLVKVIESVMDDKRTPTPQRLDGITSALRVPDTRYWRPTTDY